jgi:hypothetical protein
MSKGKMAGGEKVVASGHWKNFSDYYKMVQKSA